MPRPKISTKTRYYVAQRVQFLCEYCQIPAAYVPDPFDVEHIVPMRKKGSNDSSNLAYACGGYNGHKYNLVDAIDPADGKRAVLYHPRQHIWTDHFAWNDTFLHVVGLTPIGRASIDALHLNRPSLINLRGLLLAFGLHPPLVSG